MRCRSELLALVGLLAAPTVVTAQSSGFFVIEGPAPARDHKVLTVAGDGSAAGGSLIREETSYAFEWSVIDGEEGVTTRGDSALGEVRAIADNGKVSVGSKVVARGRAPTAVQWTFSSFLLLPSLTPAGDAACGMPWELRETRAIGVSRNGSTILGNGGIFFSALDQSGRKFCFPQPGVWINGVPRPLELPIPPVGFISGGGSAHDISDNGEIVVGEGFEGQVGQPGGYHLALIWRDGTPSIIERNTPATALQPTAVSGDGHVVAGIRRQPSSPSCFRWSSDRGFTTIAIPNQISCDAKGINGDGSVIVGSSLLGTLHQFGWVWDETHGVRDVSTYLQNEWGVPVDGLTALVPADISSDGTTLAGTAIRGDSRTVSWIARRPRTELLDPVPTLLEGPRVTKDPAILSKGGTPIQGASTDGVTQVVVRFRTTAHSADVEIRDEDDLPSDGEENGTLAIVGTATFSSTSATVLVSAVEHRSEKFFFVVYRTPANYDRLSHKYRDSLTGRRDIALRFRLSDGGQETIHLALVRPPVALVHGTFSTLAVWDSASRLSADSRLAIYRFDFSDDLSTQITTTNPPISEKQRRARPIRANVLGVDFNAHQLFNRDLPSSMQMFRAGIGSPHGLKCAAVQLDLVAHSLGGLVVRRMTRKPKFFDKTNFFKGYFHKLITLGATHLGTHQARRLMDGTNNCSRDTSARFGAYNLYWATVNGKSYNGATRDQIGDGTVTGASNAIKLLHTPLPRLPNGTALPQLPTAFIAAEWGERNRSQIVEEFGVGVRQVCDDFMARHYGLNEWNEIFDNQPNDVIVPVQSAADGQSNFILIPNVVHGSGSVGTGNPSNPHLGFDGPHLLANESDAPDHVLRLLESPLNNPRFVLIPR